MQQAGFRLRRAPLTRILAALVGAFALASIAMSCMVRFTGHDNVLGLVQLLRVDAEANLPTYFTAVLLAFAALLLVAASRGPHRPAAAWLMLAALFALMSVDEIARLHERMIWPLHAALGIEGPSPFYFTWVVPGLVFAGLVGAYYLPFVLRLPRRTGRRVVLAGAVYLGGALGMEMVGGFYASVQPDFQLRFSDAHFWYEMIVTLEETMEMAGLVVFIDALVGYCAGNLGRVELSFEEPAARVG